MAKDWTAQEILRMSGAYWAGCALQAGVQLDVFTALHDKAKEEAVLTEELGCNARAFSMLVTALVSMGFLERQPDGQINAPESVRALLSRKSDAYMGFIIRHHANIMPGWTKLDRAVRIGASTAERAAVDNEDPAEREDFLLGMFNIARLQAGRIAESLDLSGRSRLIDVGGGPGTYAIFFCRRNPELRATVFDLPSTGPVARKTIQRFGLEGRINFLAGNYQRDALPPGQDVAWLSQVLHGETPDGAAALVKNAGACLNPGGLLCVQEFVLDDNRDGPEHAALFSLNMLVQTPGGQAYTRGEIVGMLLAAGAKQVRELDIPLPQSCRILIGEF